MLTNPLPQNQNMNFKTVDLGSASGGTPNPLDIVSGHDFINTMSSKNVVTHSKDYSTSQPNLGKEPPPPKSPLCIEKPCDKPEAPPHIPKGVLNCSGHNANAKAS